VPIFGKWGRQQCTVSWTHLGPQRTLESVDNQIGALQGGCKHVSMIYFTGLFSSHHFLTLFSETGWDAKLWTFVQKSWKKPLLFPNILNAFNSSFNHFTLLYIFPIYTYMYSCTHWIRRTLHKAIKALVFANRPCTRAWSTRLAIGYNPRVKIEVKINFWESYELKTNFRGSYFHRSTSFPHTTHIQF